MPVRVRMPARSAAITGRATNASGNISQLAASIPTASVVVSYRRSRVLQRRLVCASLLFSSAFLVAQTTPKPHEQGAAPPPASREDSDLPVRRVVLYKNGVGYFEHAGRVTGNQAV